jgi:DNA invertase Pin-like site-specific DNA recombinase
MSAEPGPSFRWGIVTRRSKMNVDGTEGSTRRQELAVAARIKSDKMGVVVATYSDIASAYDENAKRPEFEAALIDLKAGRIDGIAVWKIDRLVRRAKQYRKVLDVLEESGGRLFSLVEGIDTAADGTAKIITSIVLNLLVSLAEMESENTSARVMLMHEDRARRGLVQRSHVRPFGHSDDWTQIVEHEACLIREAAERVLKGESILSIVKDWRRRGIKTARGYEWHPSPLFYVLRTPRLIGKREYGGSLFEYADVPPILDEETWQRAQDVLDARGLEVGRKESRLVSNIAVCPNCETPIVGDNRGGTSSQTYVCRKRPRFPNACGSICASGPNVDRVVGERVVEFLQDRTRVMELLKQHAHGPEMEALHQREAELSDSLLALDQALKPPPGKPRMPIDRYWALVEEIEEERRQIHRRLAVTREATLLAETLEFGEDAAAVWAERGVQWRRSILRLVTERIEIGPGGQERALRGNAGFFIGKSFDPERIGIKFAA